MIDLPPEELDTQVPDKQCTVEFQLFTSLLRVRRGWFANHALALGGLRPMKLILSFFIYATCQVCFAGEDTNIILMSDWSEPVSLRDNQLHDQAIRGRLLILQGMEPAYGGPPTTNGAMTFVELQNVGIGSIEIYFAVTNLHCELSDATGKGVPKPTGTSWGGRGPFLPCWVNLPYNSTIRLFVNGGRLNPLMVYPSGEPWSRWSIPAAGTNAYYLTGTLSVSTQTNSALPPDWHKATLIFPKTRITGGNVEVGK